MKIVHFSNAFFIQALIPAEAESGIFIFKPKQCNIIVFLFRSCNIKSLIAYTFILITIFILATGCSQSSPTSPDTPTISVSGDDNESLALVKKFNSDSSGGSTVRWGQGTAFVYDPIGIPNLQRFLDDWNNALGGRLTLVTGDSGSPIEFYWDENIVELGLATWTYSGSGQILKARIGLRTTNALVVKQEIGHSIGFFGHTSDGGVMDSGATSENITDQVKQMLRKLYDLDVGTKL